MLTSKKGLSPLIAAVLLIVVVVGIGAVVTGMIRGLVSDNQKTIKGKSTEMACGRDVSIEFVKIDGEQQVCKGSDYVTAVIDNVGTAEIDDFQIVLLTTSGVFRNESVSSSDPLVKGEAQEIRTSFSGFTKDDIVQAQFVPKLKGQGSGYTFCSDVGLKAETMSDC